MRHLTTILFGLFLFTSTLFGEDDILKKVNDLKYQTGTVTIGDKLATIKVPKGFKYLDAKQSQFVLHEVWGNPLNEGILGMLFKSDQTPISDNFTYALTYSFSEDGYVSDSDANEINYDDLLKSMKEDISEGNEDRKKEGYPTMELVGWANKPYYDSSAKKLHWAKELQFEGDSVNTLNYNIRILGRKGILELNAISDIEKLKLVQSDIPAILASTEFNDGEKYSDYSPGVDKMAAYGIGGLIAGKVLAKAGFFALLVKFWKIIAIGAVAALGFLKKLFTKKADNSSV
ncbi:DUF2167 domain-containing protein [Leptospira levettii]|uniref:DUF2167 domain-containing protein n=1 Tax=Leptospira levettii TaxID=2023178 RepID=A0AAW5UZV3_9LEPT|nr:DUF2167 domain-containing protein [Leptospira levettii]MCW7465312.1 DUF2167 domain-containing protein [Leptospira levettii]MCW7496152.1 DUF2167 domain-containing protein [Leptospira levettii]MCW7510052.1 DUF2167 domain-containing protein [Leptospira levettii]MCW7513803.1 DUF2167 domain-containing protein [Leptospira levettii]TGL73032.1 DUF2167 domain-containing protein [Leptospira levettii]